MEEKQSSTEVPPSSASKGGVLTNNLAPKLRDSCQACAMSKLKCGKQKPTCIRCVKRQIHCTYLATNRGKKRHMSEDTDNVVNSSHRLSNSTCQRSRITKSEIRPTNLTQLLPSDDLLSPLTDRVANTVAYASPIPTHSRAHFSDMASEKSTDMNELSISPNEDYTSSSSCLPTISSVADVQDLWKYFPDIGNSSNHGALATDHCSQNNNPTLFHANFLEIPPPLKHDPTSEYHASPFDVQTKSDDLAPAINASCRSLTQDLGVQSPVREHLCLKSDPSHYQYVSNANEAGLALVKPPTITSSLTRTETTGASTSSTVTTITTTVITTTMTMARRNDDSYAEIDL